MANEPQPSASTVAATPPKPSEAEQREDWFVTTANPWDEIVSLEFGGDRTYATTIERMVVNADSTQHPALEKELLTALARAELRPAGRLFICRMLALIGSATAVPALKPLLNDNATADVARLALDGIDAPSVNETYRAALDKLTGAPKAGLIGSIAVRGDVQALDLLRAIAAAPAEAKDVRTAATRAVERLETTT